MSVPCRIRVLLRGFRPLARRFVVDAVRAAPDMELIGEGDLRYESPPAFADVIVVQANPDDPDLQEPRRLRARVLEVFGGGCDVYERRLVRTNVGLDELLDVIRETAVVSGGRRDE
jgi:hypothetical protein